MLGVQIAGDFLILLGEQVEVLVGIVQHAHIGIGLLDLRTPQADIFHHRHDALEEERAEELVHLRLLSPFDAFLDRQAHHFIDFPGLETVPHVIAGLDQEFLALVALGLGQVRIIIAQGETTEGHMARLVFHDIGIDHLGQRVLGQVADRAESGQGQAFNDDLHGQIGKVPAAVAQGFIDQLAQRFGHRIGDAELLHQILVGLDVTGFIHHLSRGIEFGVEIGNGLDDLGGADQCGLLALHELRDIPGLGMTAELDAFLLRHLLPHRRPVQGNAFIGQLHRVFEIELERPVDPVDRIPLHVLALLVQVHERRAAIVVFEIECGVELLRNRPVLVEIRHRIEIAKRCHGANPPQGRPIVVRMNLFFGEQCSHSQRDSKSRAWQGKSDKCDECNEQRSSKAARPGNAGRARTIGR